MLIKGKFQWQMFFLLSWIWVPVSLQLLSMIFIVPHDVAWTCLSCNTSQHVGLCDLTPEDLVFEEPDRTVTAHYGLVCSRATQASFPGLLLFSGLLIGSSLLGSLSDRCHSDPANM